MKTKKSFRLLALTLALALIGGGFLPNSTAYAEGTTGNSITVNYLDNETMEPIAPATVMTDVTTGSAITVSAITVEGYTVVGGGTQEVTLTDENPTAVVNFAYTADAAPLTGTIHVFYVDTIQELPVADPVDMIGLPLGSHTVTAPDIAGYGHEADVTTETVTLTETDLIKSVTFYYIPDEYAATEGELTTYTKEYGSNMILAPIMTDSPLEIGVEAPIPFFYIPGYSVRWDLVEGMTVTPSPFNASHSVTVYMEPETTTPSAFATVNVTMLNEASETIGTETYNLPAEYANKRVAFLAPDVEGYTEVVNIFELNIVDAGSYDVNVHYTTNEVLPPEGQGTIVFRAVDLVNNAVLKETVSTVALGTHTVYPEIIEGYSSRTATYDVTLSVDGQTKIAEYKYTDDDFVTVQTNCVIGTEQITSPRYEYVEIGSVATITAPTLDGYDSVEPTKTLDLTTETSKFVTVEFEYIESIPDELVVTKNYVDEDGVVIKAPDTGVYYNNSLNVYTACEIEGYTVTGTNPIEIPAGSKTEDFEITFVYKKNVDTVAGLVTMKFTDFRTGEQIAPDTVQSFTVGSHQVAYPVVAGYEGTSDAKVIIVDALGTAQTVEFKYYKAGVVNVVINYMNHDGSAMVKAPETVEQPINTTHVYEAPVVEGFSVTSDAQVTVNAGSNLSVVYPVTFWYEYVGEGEVGTITTKFRDFMNQVDVMPAETITFHVGDTLTVTPAAVVGDYIILQDGTNEKAKSVTVEEADKAYEMVFTYVKSNEAVVEVNYKEVGGTVFAKTQGVYTIGEEHTYALRSDLTNGYNQVDSLTEVKFTPTEAGKIMVVTVNYTKASSGSDDGGNGGGGSGSDGGSSTPTTPTTPTVPTTPTTPTEPIQTLPTFIQDIVASVPGIKIEFKENVGIRPALKGYIGGYTDGTFKPNNSVSRGEVAQLVFNILSVEEGSANFTDVNNQDWYANAVNALASNGIFNGRPDGSFGADDSITRQDFAIAIVNIFNLELPEGFGNGAGFADLEGIYGQQAVETLIGLGVIRGYEDNTFRPDAPITRAEAVVILNRLFGDYVEGSDSAEFGDIENHWAASEIRKAAK